ncbi:unnamed protein product [Heterobilharzia americana]|nr:unnamed protein product [Heterobilharzia americana]
MYDDSKQMKALFIGSYKSNNLPMIVDKRSQRRASEATAKQRTIDTLNHTSRNLANQRVEAERRLTDYNREKETLESVLNDIKNHVMNERQKVEEMRIKINSQQASTKSQKEEIASMLQDKITKNQRRLEQVEKENRLAQSRVDQANSKLGTLESTRGQLLEVLDQYNSLLNGDENVKEPDEARVKSLLSDESPEGSLKSVDTGLGGINWPNNNGPTENDQSIYQHLTHHEPFELFSWIPIPYDPFDGNDPFKVPSKVNELNKESAEDPFGLPITNDPFKDSDPFCLDPFGLPFLMDKTKKSTSVASAFDPFKPDTICSTTLPENSLVGADFDAVFGPSSGGISNITDPFGSDPFAPPTTSFMANTDTISSNREMKNQMHSGRKSPPPRPKTQPIPGKSRPFKSMDVTSSFSGIRSADSEGDFTDLSNSSTSNSMRYRKRLCGNSIQKSAFGLKPKHSSKSKKDSQNSPSTSPSVNTKNSSKSSDIVLSDEARLSWAIMESQRLAQIEEEARRQEEADLELALRLSKLDSSGRH